MKSGVWARALPGASNPDKVSKSWRSDIALPAPMRTGLGDVPSCRKGGRTGMGEQGVLSILQFCEN